MVKRNIEKVLNRGVVEIYPSKAVLGRALAKPKELVFYYGIDPNASFLHLGHTIAARKLEQLRQLGCKVILLIGNFTATIGDPTDKTAARKALTLKETETNAKNYLRLLSPILQINDKKNPVEIKRNNDWWGKMSASQFLNLGQRVTAQRLLERDMFQERIKKGEPVYYHELAYPLLQAYDSVAINVDGEVGGNDQTFNMLMGRDLMKSMLGKNKFVITTKLLTDPTGKKMGKSEGNAIALDASAQEMFGAMMSWPDSMTTNTFELLTDIDLKKVVKWEKELSPRDFKAKLALEIVSIFHGRKKAADAQKEFEKIFRQKDVPEKIKAVKVKSKKTSAVELLAEAGLAASKGEARRMIEQGGMKLNDKIITDPFQILTLKSGDIVKRGKRHFVRIK